MSTESKSKLPFHILAVVALVALLIFSALWWLEVSKRFPELPAGSYYGAISDLGESRQEFPLYLERSKGSNEFLFIVFEKGWEAQNVRPLKREEGPPSKSGYYPIMLSGPNSTLRVIGSSIGNGRFGGIVTELETGKEGRWYLEPFKTAGRSINSLDEFKELELYVALSSELSYATTRLEALKRDIPAQKKEIDELTVFITEGDQLQKKSEDQFRSARSEFEREEQQLAKLMREAASLEDKLMLAQRLTPTGKLVALTQKAAERENRWLETMWGVAPQRSSRLESELDKAKAVEVLKRQIVEEELKIAEFEAQLDAVKGYLSDY